MNTEQMTQELALGGPISPQELTATATLASGAVDMRSSRKAYFQFQTGGFGGTSPTLAAVLQIQESPDGVSWSNNATVPPATLTGQYQQATLEIRAGQLGAGKRYARLQATCTVGGTSPAIPVSGTILGGAGIHKPNNANNDFSVVSQTVVD